MPVTSLCVKEDVLARLQMPPDSPDAAVVESLRLAVEDRILSLTGFTFLEGGVQSEEQIDVQLGVSRVMRLRPLVPIDPTSVTRYVTLEARSMASDTYAQIIGDLRVPFEGRIMPLASELTPIFPPVGGLAPWLRWRQMIWPGVRVTYKVQALGDGTGGTLKVPAALARAAIDWAASLYAMPGAGRLRSLNLERVSEAYVDQAVPRHVQGLLHLFVREKSLMVF